MEHSTQDVTVDGVRIHLRRSGDGSPALFLHGAGGVMHWPTLFDRLASAHTLLVPDHPGFGESDDPPWIRSVPDLAMFYLDLLEHLGLSGVRLVGHSLGGWIAAELAIRDRARLQSLTLIAPAGIRVKGAPPGDPFLWSREEHAHAVFFDRSLAEQMLAHTPSEAEIELQVKNRYAFAKLAWQPRLFNPDLEKWLHRIKLPSLVIWGAEDRVLPPAYAGLWGQRLPQATTVMIPRCGHLPHIEQAAQVAEAIERFFGEVPA